MRFLCLLPACAALFAATPTTPPTPSVDDPVLKPETATVGNKQVKVLADKEFTFTPQPDADRASITLWYQTFNGTNWGAWQKHGQSFAKDGPVVWAAPEGHQRIYLQQTYTSGLTDDAPGPTSAAAERIYDRTAPTVAVTFPGARAKLRGGDKYTVTWTASDANLRSTPISVKFSRDGKGTFETIATNLPNSGSWEWTVPLSMTTSGVLRVEAADKATNVGLAEVSGLLIDSIKPRGRVTGPAISARSDLTLDLDVGDEPKTGAGLTAARIWISSDDGTSWTEGPFVTEPFRQVAWKAAADGRFRVAVVATDGAGNQTAIPKGKEGEVLIVDTQAPQISLSAAIGITDAVNPGPGGRTAFKAGDRVQIPFVVTDPNITPNSVAVSIQYDPASPWRDLATAEPTDSAAYRFEIPADAPATAQAKVRVRASDNAGNVGEAVSSQPFQIQVKKQVLIIDP